MQDLRVHCDVWKAAIPPVSGTLNLTCDYMHYMLQEEDHTGYKSTVLASGLPILSIGGNAMDLRVDDSAAHRIFVHLEIEKERVLPELPASF